MKSGISLLVLIVAIIIYIVGIFAHVHPPLFDTMILLTPWFLSANAILIALQLIFSSVRTSAQKKGIFFWFILCWLISYSLEVIGVQTGAIFGDYLYGTTLGPKVLGVPLLIGLNWCMIIFGSAETIRMKRGSLVMGVVVTAACTLLFDLVLEPVAMSNLAYWSWFGGSVPGQNYFAWFVIAFVFAVFYFWMVPYSPAANATNASPLGAAAPGAGVAAPGAPNKVQPLLHFCEKYFPGLLMLLQFIFIAVLNFNVSLL